MIRPHFISLAPKKSDTSVGKFSGTSQMAEHTYPGMRNIKT